MDGEPLVTISGPIWHSLPQTPQAAEHVVAFAAMAEILCGPAVAHSDCQSVANMAGMSLRRALDGRCRHAAIFKHAAGQEAQQWLCDTVKGKAHVVEPGQERTIGDLEQRRHAIGNNLADLAAKKGLNAHPGPSEAELEVVTRYVGKLVRVALVLARACKMWPSSREYNGATGEGLPNCETLTFEMHSQFAI